jgi:nucleotide-binding universal stress UspA family protein
MYDVKIAMRAIALVGDPKVEIVKKVSELEADVLVMGTRQLGSFKR